MPTHTYTYIRKHVNTKNLPVNFFSAIFTDTGNISVKHVIEFGTFTTRSYFTIFVMKFLWDKSSLMGIRTRSTHVVGKFTRRSSTIAW